MHSEELTTLLLKEAGLFDPVTKYFASREKKKAAKRIDSHFRTDSTNKWDSFISNVRRKSFVKGLSQDARSDQKLLRHADNLNRLQMGKEVGSITGNTGQSYKITKLRGKKRLGCTCNDWRYKRSVVTENSPDSEKDCKHIKEWKSKKSGGPTKMAASEVFLASFMNEVEKNVGKGVLTSYVHGSLR